MVKKIDSSDKRVRRCGRDGVRWTAKLGKNRSKPERGAIFFFNPTLGF